MQSRAYLHQALFEDGSRKLIYDPGFCPISAALSMQGLQLTLVLVVPLLQLLHSSRAMIMDCCCCGPEIPRFLIKVSLQLF